jgi:hypothetical protein
LLPTINLSTTSASEACSTLSKAASTTGCTLLANLTTKPPITSIQSLFSALYSNPALASRLNATYPTRGVFKAACHSPTSSSSIDQRTTIDLSITPLEKLRQLDPALVSELGDDFDNVLKFYETVERDFLPLLMQATSRSQEVILSRSTRIGIIIFD